MPVKVIKITKREEKALKYASEFLHNSFLGHKNDSLGKAIKPELLQLMKICKKLTPKNEYGNQKTFHKNKDQTKQSKFFAGPSLFCETFFRIAPGKKS